MSENRLDISQVVSSLLARPESLAEGHLAAIDRPTKMSSEGTALAEDLVSRCQKLLDELEAFRSFIQETKDGTSSSYVENVVGEYRASRP